MHKPPIRHEGLPFLQKKLGITAKYSTFALEAFKNNVLIWCMFMSSSKKADTHLGPNNLANLKIYNITQKLIIEHSKEILNVHTIESASPSWTRPTLAHKQIIQWTKAKYVNIQTPFYVW